MRGWSKNDDQPALPRFNCPRFLHLSQRRSNRKKGPGGSDAGSRHFRPSARTIADATIGLADGLTVPFALTAGLSGIGSVNVVVLGGLAELISGSISMGLGGWLGARGEEQTEDGQFQLLVGHCESQREKTSMSITAALGSYGLHLNAEQIQRVASMAGEDLATLLQRLEPNFDPSGSSATVPRSPFLVGLTIAVGYLVGGLTPLLPYVIDWGLSERTESEGSVMVSRAISIGVMVIALLVFGYVKTCISTGWRGKRNVLKGVVGGIEMLVVGGIAAGAAVGLVYALQSAE